MSSSGKNPAPQPGAADAATEAFKAIKDAADALLGVVKEQQKTTADQQKLADEEKKNAVDRLSADEKFFHNLEQASSKLSKAQQAQAERHAARYNPASEIARNLQSSTATRGGFYAEMEANAARRREASEETLQQRLTRSGKGVRQMRRAFTALHSVEGIGNLLGGEAGGFYGYAGMQAIGAVQGGLGGATRAMGIAQNASLSDEQKHRMMTEEMPIVGGLLRSLRQFGQALDGSAELIRSSAERYANLRADNAAAQGLASQRNTGQGQLDEAENRARGLAGATAPRQQLFDRSTSSGEAAYQNAQRLLPLEDRLAAARRESAIAAANEESARQRTLGGEARLSGIIHDRNAALGRLGAAQRRQSQYGNGNFFTTANFMSRTFNPSNPGLGDQTGAINEAGEQLRTQAERLAAAHRDQGQRDQDYRAAGLARVQAQQREQEARLDLSRGHFSNLQQAEANMTNRAGRFGRMSRMERAQGLYAARQIRLHGIQNVPRHLIEHADRFDSAFVDREAQRFGENTPEYRAHQAEFAAPLEKGSLADIRNDLATLQDRIRQETLDVAKLSADATIAVIREAFRLFNSAIEKAVMEERHAREQGQANAHGLEGQ